MWTTNAGLTDRHVYDSRPDSWPRMIRGIVSMAFRRTDSMLILFVELLG